MTTMTLGGHVSALRTCARERKPYVVSLDLIPLLERWARKSGWVMPEKQIFTDLRRGLMSDLSRIFDDVELISEEDVRTTLLKYVDQPHLPVVTLDQAYCPYGYPLHMTRAITRELEDVGITHRTIGGDIEAQVAKMASQITGDAVLVDDVIFSGDMIVQHVLPMLKRHGIHVHTVAAGIGIGDGVHRVAEHVPEVRCVNIYPRVIDEICERDFYPGAPLSGRTVIGEESYGAPYIRPFGDPVKWASLPEHFVPEFSRECIRRAIALFEAIEDSSGRALRCADLPRRVLGLPCGHGRYVDELQRVLGSM